MSLILCDQTVRADFCILVLMALIDSRLETANKL